MMNVGREYRQDVLNALSALQDVCVRSLKLDGKFICQGNEFELIKAGFEVHTAQLEVATIGSIRSCHQAGLQHTQGKTGKGDSRCVKLCRSMSNCYAKHGQCLLLQSEK